jgi:thiol-disulfide isomerase/thioredoxin
MMFVSLGLGTLVALVTIALVSWASGPSSSTSTTAPVAAIVGKVIAPISLPSLAYGSQPAGQVTIPREGRATVLVFFASWCGPCQEEIPRLSKYVTMLSPTLPVDIRFVDANDSVAPAQAFLTAAHATSVVLSDSNGNVTSGIFGFQTLPETVFLSSRGVVTRAIFGSVSNAQFASAVTEILSQK